MTHEMFTGQEGNDVRDVITQQNPILDARGQYWSRFTQLQSLDERTQLLSENVNEVKLGHSGQ